MTEMQKELLYQIAGLWRGDWSGMRFDGRDGLDWIHCVIEGSPEEHEQLKKRLDELESDYNW